MNSSIVFSYLINGIIITSAAYLVYGKIKDSALRQFYIPALLFKLVCTIAICLLYTRFYQGGDVTIFFSKAEALSRLSIGEYLDAIFSKTALNDQRRAIYFERIMSLFLLITKSDFWMLSFYFSSICFFSVFYFVLQFQRVYSKCQYAIVIAFLFFPSVVFWSSGLVKETLTLASMMFLAGLTMKLSEKNPTTWVEWLLTTIAVLFLMTVKYYIAVSFLPLLIAYWLYSYKTKMTQKQWYFYVLSLILILVIALPFIHPNLTPAFFLKSIEIARETLILNSNPHNIVYLYNESNFFVNGLINFFILIFSGLFRPILFESFSFPVVLATIENTLIFVLFVTRFFGSVVLDKKQLYFIILLTSYIVIMAILFTYSAPNFGTLSRFKIYYMPFFLILILGNHPIINWMKGLKQKNL